MEAEPWALTTGCSPTQHPPHLDPSYGEAVSLGFLGLTVLPPTDDYSDFCVSGTHLLLNLSCGSEIRLSFYKKVPETQGPGLYHLAPMHPWSQTVHSNSFCGRKVLFLICFHSTPEPRNFSLAQHMTHASLSSFPFPLPVLLSTYATPFQRPYFPAMPNIKAQN